MYLVLLEYPGFLFMRGPDESRFSFVFVFCARYLTRCSWYKRKQERIIPKAKKKMMNQDEQTTNDKVTRTKKKEEEKESACPDSKRDTNSVVTKPRHSRDTSL